MRDAVKTSLSEQEKKDTSRVLKVVLYFKCSFISYASYDFNMFAGADDGNDV